MFTNYDKVGKTGTQSDELEEYESEEDKKVLCLLVNITELHKSKEHDYIRTLFRKSKYYEERLLKRKDLVFSTNHTNFMQDEEEESKDELKEETVIEYYDVMF
jgi:GTPase involved in cell partitioning and DNA repair